MDIQALRAQTPGCAQRIHLNNAGAALMAQPTLDAMTGMLRLEAEIGGYEAAAESRDAIAATHDALAELVGGQGEEIALFDNATRAWHAAFYSVPLRPGDQVLTGRAEYGSNVLAYWQAARRTGAEVVVVSNDRHGQLDVAALAELAGERTALIGVSHVPTSGGLVQPVAEIGRIARACGALFLLDATQSAGQFPVDVDAIGCDLVAGTGRKFLRGPRGTGFLWARNAVLEKLDPYVAEIASATWDGHRGFTWAAGAAGSPPGSRALSTSWASVRPSARPSTWAWRLSGSARPHWAPGCAPSSPGCPASRSTTSARSAARSSPRRSRTCPPSRPPRLWPAPGSTSL